MKLRDLLAACIIAVPAAAFGQTAPAESARTTRSGVYTAAQASRGGAIYALSCASCHSAATHASPTFVARWTGHSLAELFQYMNEEMPKENPGSLSPREYTLVLAYLLKMNGMPAGKTDLPTTTAELEKIRIELRPVPDTASR
jgi:mono/diheme cytochrome c family protein